MATTVVLDGLTFNSEPGPTDIWKLTDLAGWYSSPTVTTTIDQAPLSDYAFGPARSYRGAKTLSLEGVTYGQTADRAISAAWQAISAVGTHGQQMTIDVTDELDTKRMRVWLASAPQVLPFGPGKARFQIPLVANDGRKYGTQRDIFIAPSGTATDGLHFPLGDVSTGYLNFGTFNTAGVTYAINFGTADTYPVFRVQGQIGNAGFTIVSGDSTIVYTGGIGQGASVTLSPYAGGRAVSNDGSDVTSYLSQLTWPVVTPGQQREFQFIANGTISTSAGMTLSISDAYW